MQEPTVADMSISDEHIVVEPKTTVSSIATELSGNPRNAILVKKKGSGIIHGVVTSRDIFSKMSEGSNVTKMRLEKIMRTNIMTFQDSTPLKQALQEMSKQVPDAIVITDSEGLFMGYFSAEDYRDAARRLESHQMMSARLERSKNALSKAASDGDDEEEEENDLLDLLLGDFDEEEEEEIAANTMTLG